jgi:hypothetical protein
MQNVSGITIHGGWPSQKWFGSFVTTILSSPWSATSFSLQIHMLAAVTSTSWGLSKCHSDLEPIAALSRINQEHTEILQALTIKKPTLPAQLALL